MKKEDDDDWYYGGRPSRIVVPAGEITMNVDGYGADSRTVPVWLDEGEMPVITTDTETGTTTLTTRQQTVLVPPRGEEGPIFVKQNEANG
jgi:hypothetical protein